MRSSRGHHAAVLALASIASAAIFASASAAKGAETAGVGRESSTTTYSSAGAQPAAASPAQPDLIFLMADQLRFDAAYDARIMPNLARLAAEGVRFTRAYTSTPTCTPARAALLTGQKPWNHGMLGYGSIAPRYPFEMPRAMANAGFSTHSFGKDHFNWVHNKTWDDGLPHGYQTLQLYDGIVTEPDQYHSWFEAAMGGRKPESGWPTLDMNSWRGAPYVYNESYHPTAWVGREAVEFVNNVSAVRQSLPAGASAPPFFLKVSWHRPHSPYDPPQRLLDTVSSDMLPPIRTATDGWDNRFRGPDLGCGPKDADAWCGEMPANETVLARRAYYASIKFVDEWLGHLLDTLNQTGILSNAVILWTADHGDGQGDHYHWRKGYPYELSSHIPMVLRWPDAYPHSKLERGSTLEHVTELRDIFPTFLDAAGANGAVPAGHTIDGASLLCLVRDPSGASCNNGAGWRSVLDLEHSTCYNETNHWNALTDGAVKYVFRAFYPNEQLFNLTADPYEEVDLSTNPAYAKTLATWRGRMVAQFEAEGRGSDWVKDGKLQRRTKPQTYGPNYPGKAPSEQEWDSYQLLG